MAKVAKSDGSEAMIVARKQLTDEDLLLNRDVLMYARVCEGNRVVDVATEFRLSRKYVHRRLQKIAVKAKEYIRKRVGEHTRDGICLLPEDAIESAKRLIRKGRRSGLD